MSAEEAFFASTFLEENAQIQLLADVRFAPIATGLRTSQKVRFVPRAAVSNRNKAAPYSISSSASNCIELGTESPSTFAALRLITNSNLVDRCTGRSAGFSPLMMRPA
jgi:hypothetical protein